MTPLIDATEMYLRTVWELLEEGIPPMRARLVERLGVRLCACVSSRQNLG